MSQENSNQTEDVYKNQKVRLSTLGLMAKLKLKGETFDSKVKEVIHELQKIRKRLGQKTASSLEEPVEKKEAELKFIITRYPGQCKKCGNDVPEGSPVYWAPDVLMCLDCAVDTKSDKALMTRYLKARELDKILHMLKEESNKYADQINELKYGVKFNELVLKFDEMLSLNTEYLHTLPEDTKDPVIVRLKKLCDETPAEMLELKAAVTTKFAPIKRKKRRVRPPYG